MTEKTPAEVTIRGAYADECLPLTRLFNPPFPMGPATQWLVAVRPGQRERPVGMAALAWLADGDGVEGTAAQLFWRVLPGYLDSSLAADLIRRALEIPLPAHVAQVIAHPVLAFGDPTEVMLADLGFVPWEQLDTFQADFMPVWERCRRVTERARSRGLIPAGVQAQRFTPERLPTLRALFHNQGIINCLDFDARLAPGHDEPTDLDGSTVLVLDGELIAAMLVCPCQDGHGYLVPGRWVHADYRNGWANALLIFNSVRQGVPIGLEFVRFVANRERHRETARLAARLGGEHISRLQRWHWACQGQAAPITV